MFRDPSNVPGDGVCSAQALAAAALEAIGKIRTASGSVTVMRADGEIVRVSVGDLVYRGDTIETEADGAVGITFADGTALDLSAAARLVLNEFVCDPAGTPNSALFSLVQGAFSFVAGKIARTGGLRIDTPFATIRGTAQDRGIGILTLAALTFAAIKESEAASRHDAFLDDGTITYKDLPHGTFEIVTRDGRVIMADDPGETIVVDPTGSVARLPNSSSRMAELQQAQHSALATFSLGQEGGAAGGSSSPGFDIPVQLQPINFSQPRNDAPTEIVTTHITAASAGFIPVPQQLNPPPPVVTPVLGSAGFSMVTETVNTTGSTHVDTVSSGTLTFTDFQVTTVSATIASMTWSGGATPPSGLAEVLAGALSITTESANPVSGSIATTFSAADRNFDFLAANETLTIVYDVTVTDNQGVSLTRPVTITIIGTNDAPVLAADASGPHTVTEGLNTTGTFVFTDVDLTDHHTVSTSVTSATWSGGATLPSGVAAALAGALSATASDGTGSGSGSVAVTFSAADSAFDFLAAGQTLTITYNVTVSDITGASSTRPVTITVTGTDDAPVLSVAATASYSENAAPVTLSPAAAVSDVDNQTLASATATITDFVAGDVLAFTNTNTTTYGNITATYNAGVLSLTSAGATATLAQWQAALDAVQYSSTSDNPTTFGTDTSRTISWVVNDGALNSSIQTTTLSIVAADDAPVLSVAATASYPEQAPAVTLSPAATVSDVDNQTLASATATITDFVAGDVLAFTNTNTTTYGNITATYNAGVLSLTSAGATATLAQWQAALDAVQYSSTSDNPTTFGTDTSRTISWVVNDGALNSSIQTTTLSIVAADDAPVLSVAATASYPEQAPAVTLSPAATVSDVDNQTLASATATITDFVAGDVLAFTNTNTTTYGNITATYNAGVLSLTSAGATATLAQWQAALDAVQYSSTSDNPTTFGTDTSRTISWVVNDGALNSSIQTTTLSIVAADDAPVLSVAATASYPEQAPAVTLSPAATVSDVDNQTLASATATITDFVAGDVLAFTNTNTTTYGNITATYNAGVLSLTSAGATATLAQWQAALDAVQYSSTSDNPTTFGTDTSRTISWVVNDGALNSSIQTTTLSIVAADDAPVLSVAATASYPEQAPAVTLSPAATVSDVDNQTLASATATITDFVAGDVLAFTNTNTTTYGNITATYNAGVLSLTSAGATATLAQWQAALDAVQYSSTSDNPTTFGTDTSRTISWVVNDGALNSSIQTTTLSIVAADDAPVLSVAATASYPEQAPAVTLSPAATVSDVDNQTLASATATITDFVAGDVLAFTNTNTTTYGNITATYNAGVLSLTSAGATATLAQWQAALDAVQYSSTSDNPTTFGTDTSRTISWVVNDGALNSSIQTTTLSIVAADDAPVLSVAATASYPEQAPAVTLSPAATVSDVDNQTLASATATITDFVAGDVLAFTNTNTTTYGNITATYNAGVLSLTSAGATATLAQWQAALDAVQYSSTSDNPTTFGTDTSRTISWVVNDGALNSSIQTTTLSIVAADDAPVLSVAATASYPEQAPAVTLSPAATVSDVDNQTLASATATITDFVAGDVLAFTNTNTTTYGNITATYNAGVLSLTSAGATATLAQWQAALDAVQYSSTSDNPTTFGTDTSRTISWVVNDGALNSSIQTTTLSIVAADDAPVLSVAATASYPEQAPAVTLSPAATVSDVDNQTLASATATITDFVAGDVLAFTNTNTTTYGNITATYNAGVLSLTSAGATATLAQWQAALDAVQYSSTSDNPTTFGTDTSRTISWVVNDGALNSSIQTTTLSIVAADDAPVLSVAATASYSENAAPVTLSPAATVSDVDNQTLASATATITDFVAGDVLAFTNTNTTTYGNITATYNAGVLSLTSAGATATLAQWQAALDAVQYSSTSDNPTTFGTDTSRTISWVVNDGALNSSIQTTTLSIVAVNDAPVATITPATYSATEQGNLNLKNSGMSVSDVDNLGGVETVTLSVTEGTLTVTAGTSGATVQGSGSNSVIITGTLAQINALLNTDGTSTVSYTDNTDTPSANTTLTLSINDNGNIGAGGALTGSDTASINITAVNDAPVATIVPTTYSAAGSLNLKNTGMSVSDIDSLGGVETVRLSVTEGTLTVTAGTSGAAVSGNGTSTVTITGTLAQINALLNTDSTSTVSYIDNVSPPSASATLTLSINDNGNTGGGALTSSDTATINVAFLIAPGTVFDLKGGTLPNPLIENDGTIRTGSNNASTILGSVTGTGTIEITNNTTLIINGSVGSGQTVLFDIGSGPAPLLVLQNPSGFQAKISGFQGSDQIDLGGMTIAQATAWVASITFVGFTGTFKFASDGHGGTLVSDPPASTATSDATVVPVVETTTLTATETAGSQTDVSAATVDGTTVARSTAVLEPDGDKTTNVTVNGNGAVAHTARIVSGPGSLMVNPGAAPEFTSLSHGISGNLTDNRTVEVSNAPELGRMAPSRDRSAVNVLEGQIAIASVMLVLEHLTEKLKLASDANAGTLIADPPASPDATVAAVADTRTVKAADTADTQATPVAADEGAVAAHDVAITPDGGMSDLTISGLPSDFALTENEGDEPTATHDAISLAYSEFTDHGQHGSGKDHTTAANVATTHSAEGQTAAKASVSMSSHTTSSETGSDGNSNGGDAARIHDAIAGHSSTIDTVGTTISDSVSSSFRGATSGHVNDQPHFENATPGTLQSLESPTQAASHAADIPSVAAVEDANGGHAVHSHDVAAEHSFDIPATTIAESDAPGARGEPPGHVNDQPQLGNADPGNNGLGHQSRELPNQAASQAAKDSPPVTAGEDANGGHAAHTHGTAAKDASTIDIADATVADNDSPGYRGEGRGHLNDQPQSGNADPGNNGLGHQSRELPSQASAQAAKDVPVEDAKGDHAAHTHGAAAKDSSTIDTPAPVIAESDAPGARGEPPGHVNDKAQSGNADPGNNGHQSRELPSQASAQAAKDVPVEDAKGDHAAHTHGAAAKDSSTIDTPATPIADSDAAGVRGEPPGHVNDQAQSGNADPGNNGLGHQPSELSSQAAAAGDIPPVVAVEDAKGGHATHTDGAAAKDSSTFDTPATTVAESDAAGVRGEPPGHGNDKSQLADADPGNNGLGHQSRESPSQASVQTAKDIPPVTAVENAKGDDAAHTHGAAAKDSSTIDTAGTAVAHTDSSGSQGAAAEDMSDPFHFANTNPGTSQSTELPSHADAQLAGEIPVSTTDNSAIGHADDFNAAALPNAVEDAKGSDMAQIRGAAAKDLSTTDVAGATVVGHNDSSSFQGALSGEMNDQFHFANANPGTSQSTELPSHADAQLAGEIPVSTTDNSAIGHADDFNAAALPNAVEDAKGSDMAQIRGAAAKDLSTTDVAGATVVGHNDSSSFQGALSGEMNDQFHFANANPGNNGLGQQSLELASQTTSHAAVDIPAATTELGQIVDDVLTQAAQAALDPGTTPDHNSQLPWTNTDQHNRSSDFITHA